MIQRHNFIHVEHIAVHTCNTTRINRIFHLRSVPVVNVNISLNHLSYISYVTYNYTKQKNYASHLKHVLLTIRNFVSYMYKKTKKGY